MSNERTKELLIRLMDVATDRVELDGAMILFQRLGFTGDELQELGYVDEFCMD